MMCAWMLSSDVWLACPAVNKSRVALLFSRSELSDIPRVPSSSAMDDLEYLLPLDVSETAWH